MGASMEKEDPADLHADLRRIGENYRKIAEVAERMEAASSDRNTNKNTNVVNAGAAGVWIAVTCCLVMLVAMWMTNARMTDLRVDMQAERQSRESMGHWTAQEVTAIRSYITTGRIQPMQPRPIASGESKDKK